MPELPHPNLYVLDDAHNVVSAKDVFEWSNFKENFEKRVVKKTNITDNIRVSTVFWGVDNSSTGTAVKPLVFETRVFGGPLDDACEDYATWDEAEAGHDRWVVRATKTA